MNYYLLFIYNFLGLQIIKAKRRNLNDLYFEDLLIESSDNKGLINDTKTLFL